MADQPELCGALPLFFSAAQRGKDRTKVLDVVAPGLRVEGPVLVGRIIGNNPDETKKPNYFEEILGGLLSQEVDHPETQKFLASTQDNVASIEKLEMAINFLEEEKLRMGNFFPEQMQAILEVFSIRLDEINSAIAEGRQPPPFKEKID